MPFENEKQGLWNVPAAKRRPAANGSRGDAPLREFEGAEPPAEARSAPTGTE